MKITLEIPSRVMRIAEEINNIPEMDEYEKSRIKIHNKAKEKDIEKLHLIFRTIYAKIDSIYKREKIRTKKQKMEIDDARIVISLMKRYDGKKSGRTDDEIREFFNDTLNRLEWTVDMNTVERFVDWLHWRD